MLCECGCDRAVGRCPVGVSLMHEGWRQRQAARAFRWANVDPVCHEKPGPACYVTLTPGEMYEYRYGVAG